MKFLIVAAIFGGSVLVFFTSEYFRDVRSHNNIDSTVHDIRATSKTLTKKVVTLSDGVVLYPDIPMHRYRERITKKDFGIFITPENSPVTPERFSGYHTGIDLEVFEDEIDREVVVNAICNGDVLRSQYVRGYGGVVVQKCRISDEEMTVLYGHLTPEDLVTNAQSLSYGEKIGLLGDDQSVQTDGERKHLHLGIRRGTDIDFRGYVQTKEELDMWIDPCDVIECNMQIK